MSKLRQMVVAPKMESLFTAAVVLFGFRLGARPIGDNSMFTHLRTGIDMVANGSIPTAPYNECHWPPADSNYLDLYAQALAEV